MKARSALARGQLAEAKGGSGHSMIHSANVLPQSSLFNDFVPLSGYSMTARQ